MVPGNPPDAPCRLVRIAMTKAPDLLLLVIGARPGRLRRARDASESTGVGPSPSCRRRTGR